MTVLWMICRIAFVDFDNVEEATAAVKANNDKEVDGRKLHVSLDRTEGKFTSVFPSFLLNSSNIFTPQPHCLQCRALYSYGNYIRLSVCHTLVPYPDV